MKNLLCVALSLSSNSCVFPALCPNVQSCIVFSQSHVIQDDKAFYSYIFPIPMFLKSCVPLRG